MEGCTVSNLQLIEALCCLVEQQSGIIRDLATALEQERSLSEAEREAVRSAGERYREIFGAGEVPDDL